MALKDTMFETIKKASTELPPDVIAAIRAGEKNEVQSSSARYAMEIILENIKLAADKCQPLCQDTGSILFFVHHPLAFDQLNFEEAARQAVIEATEKGYLRQNSVDSLTEINSGNNIGPGSPSFHFHQWTKGEVEVRLMLKGGGCENVGAQYSLPMHSLNAGRDIDGVRKCLLDAICQAQGKGCGPGILGVCIGGDRADGYLQSKEQLFRKLDDVNPNPTLAKLEADILESGNKLGIGPMGFGGKTTLLGCKIGALNRLPASYYVTISYMCWADRRVTALIKTNGELISFDY